MHKDAKIYVAGHTGLVGSALVRLLQKNDFKNIVTKSYHELDLRNQQATNSFFEQERPEYVFLAAAKVGGIKANNDFPADFIYENLMIEASVIHASYRYGVTKLLFLGSSCIYPRECPQPIQEEYLLTGPLEKTNESYALAKIAGVNMCQAYRRQYGCNFISVMPTNLYGPGDNFDYLSSHVIPALIAKMCDAKRSGAPSVELWGDGTPRREFLYMDDLAEALLFIMQEYNDALPLNIGTGEDISIFDLAHLIKNTVNYTGALQFNTQMPNGTPRKVLQVDRLHTLGWKHTTSLIDGIQKTAAWYEERYNNVVNRDGKIMHSIIQTS